LRRERVPVDRVLSSRWCRCLDTARLLGLGKVEPFEPLNSFFEERGQQEAQTRAVRERMAAWRGPGNLMMVTHQVNITAASIQRAARPW
jgi:broad specificity phosphatase PhoE